MAKIAARRGYGITSVEFFVMGAIAKAVATVLTYPLQIAQSKLRADKGKGPNHTKTYNGRCILFVCNLVESFALPVYVCMFSGALIEFYFRVSALSLFFCLCELTNPYIKRACI
jgi:Sec-independent protein secretion pathway component TatC